jgi:uncharacterized protein YqgQ
MFLMFGYAMYFQDLQSKIELLETKLAEALEENKMYRAQEKRYLSFSCTLNLNTLL